ncbi:MAG: cohesin domain-containing protein [bacterium]|nr:cohesin domain-containing protein [bacterium]
MDAIEDSLFSLNDIDTTAPGVQILSTGVNGNYTLNRIPTGRWILTASVARHLTGHDTLQIHPGQDLNNIRPVLDGNGVDRSKLLTGDAAGYTGSDGKSLPDNFIDSADINAINVALFAQAGDADYNPFADVNRDDIINAIDKNFAAVNQTSNSGQTGRIRPVFPTFKQIVPEGKNTDAIVTLSGLPTSPLQAGDSLDVAIEVQGAVAVRTYEVHLTYDPALLQVEDLISTGSLFQNYLVDMAVKDREGNVSLANSIIGRTPIGGSGNGTLAVLRFRVIGKADQTQMALNDVTLIDVSNTNAKPKLTDPITLLLTNTAPVYHDREGNEIQGLILADEDATVDFNDFLVLSKAFGARAGRKGFDRRADLNVDGRVDFADFLLFSNDFGKVAVDAPASS